MIDCISLSDSHHLSPLSSFTLPRPLPPMPASSNTPRRLQNRPSSLDLHASAVRRRMSFPQLKSPSAALLKSPTTPTVRIRPILSPNTAQGSGTPLSPLPPSPLVKVSLPRVLPRPPKLPAVPEDRLAPFGLNNIPPEYALEHLASCARGPNTHTFRLRAPGEQPAAEDATPALLVPVEGLRFAAACAALPLLPRSPTTPNQNLPVMDLSLPYPAAVSYVNDLLAGRDPQAWQACKTRNDWLRRAGELQHVWSDCVALQVSHPMVWSHIDRLWSECLKGIEGSSAM